jgi:hypothetical protein
VWAGFWEVAVEPSPKLHDHEVGVPVEVSVNWTDCPAAGDDGLNVNDEERAAILATLTVLLTFFDPEPLLAVSV